MGRPLAKRFFGNRNVGSASVLTDDGIGGEGIASIDWSTLGAFRGNGTFGITGLALPAPTLPGGVQATWDLLFEVEGVSTGAGKTNLQVGDTFGHANTPGMVAKVTDLSGANAVFSLTTTGASRGNALAYANLMADTQGLTLTKIAGTGTAGTFLVDLNYRVKSADIVEKGSGYTGAETFTAVVTGNGGSQTAPAGTLVLTTDSGRQGGGGNATTNQENAIKIYANVDGSALIGDIVKQQSTRRYKVKTADGTAVCKLVADDTPAVNEAYVLATDITGNEYFVTKITSRKCVVSRKSGGESYEFADPTTYPNGQVVKWTFGTQVLNSSVKIDNV